ncbi:phenylacetate--CoA ligase family protein [Parahaliea aestuarii]|uniref:Phenylacetate--CoA ligase family protein n=1 Tax=Parahaliea aestuarii TaxID=1852021 RepID=A0A5C8ZM60_9GAMM|nr:AMP-binding protein [Parahaliea aestuarii]TXS89646.1 phenylacetate--CoA ligase family protein [Parahaliea aestuarii]
MSLYTRLVSGALFPLHERLKGHSTVAVWRQMEGAQWQSQADIRAAQLVRLRDFLSHIGQHVPYYRDLFRQSGFKPSGLQSLEDLAQLPLLDKKQIRAHESSLRSERAGELQRFNTGGSSGEPLVFYLDSERVSHDVAAKWRATRWWGVDIGDPEIVIWGSPIELGAQDRVRLWRDRLFRTRLLSAFEMSAGKMEDYLAEIRRRRPKMLFGYPSAISLLAGRAQELGWSMHDLGIRVVFVTSERLYDHQRAAIESCFGCPVANGYGGRDAGFVAHQCPAGSLHLTADDQVVEIVDSDGTPLPVGASGEIVVTHMATRAFPFVRYRTGDIGRLATEPCSCGRGLPVLAEVEGRSTDFLVAQDGTRVHGLALIYILRDMPEVSAFKIVQQSVDQVDVELVPGPGFGEAHVMRIGDGFRRRLGQGVAVNVNPVGELRVEKSGKFRYVTSRVSS